VALASCVLGIHPDGDRFITIFPEQRTSSGAPVLSRIDVVFNWFEELKEHVPADGKISER